MTSLINTNLNSLTAQRAVDRTAGGLSTTIQRLSSGLRINGASDDAAGLAISDRFSSQIRGLNQAARNANDGISMAQTAEGALSAISGNLQRLRELAVQAANGTNSAADRTALQAEYGQLASEIDRIAASTQFNGQNLLDGSFFTQRFQVGANREQSITVDNIANASTNSLGQRLAIVGRISSSLTGAGGVLINGVDVYQGQTINGTGKDVAAAINALNISGVSAAANPTKFVGTFSGSGGVTPGTGTLTINGISVAIGVTNNHATDVATALAAIVANKVAMGVTAENAGGGITLTRADGGDITISWAPGTATGSHEMDIGLHVGFFNKFNTFTLSNANTTPIDISGIWPGQFGLTAGAAAPSVVGATLAQTSVATVSGANIALDSLDAALNSVNASRAKLGALQNRFASTKSFPNEV